MPWSVITIAVEAPASHRTEEIVRETAHQVMATTGRRVVAQFVDLGGQLRQTHVYPPPPDIPIEEFRS